MITEKLKEVAQHKEEGNEAFKNGEYAQAVLFYTLGVEKVTPILPNEIYPMLLSNRSACFLKLGHHEKALKGERAILKRVLKNDVFFFRFCAF